jgi:hypothetical protein
MTVALRGLSDVFGIEVYPYHEGACLLSHIVCYRTDTTANIQHPLPGMNPADKKVMVLEVAVLGVNAIAVLNCLLPLESVEICIQMEEEAQCLISR